MKDPVGPYDVLVVDPPWSYGSDTGRTRTAEHHYDTIGNDGKEINRVTGAGIENIIRETPIGDWAKPNAHLYLWVTNPKLPFAWQVMRAWGFVYKTTLTWVKTTQTGSVHRGGMGWFYRGATEHVLFGVRGDKAIPSSLRQPNVIMGCPTGHSTKPVEFYELLRQIYPADQKMLDVYGRQLHARFDAWGKEAGGQVHDRDGGIER